MSDLPPPRIGPPTPSKLAWYRQPFVVIVVAGGLLFGIVVALNQLGFGTNQKNETEPVGVTEVCAALRNSSNDSLTKGDWERLTDWPDWKLQRYVLANCPEQYDRVD